MSSMATPALADIEELFNNLKISVEKKSNVADILKKLSEKLNTEIPDNLKINPDIIDQFITLLQQDKPGVWEKAAEVIAALAKEESRREELSNDKIITCLCQILRSENLSEELTKQACRALGNLCYENDKCRKLVDESNGLKIITNVVKQTVKLGKTIRGAELRSCAVGLLLNFVVGNGDLDPLLLRSECIDLLCDVLDCGITSKDDDAAAIHCLIIFGVLADAESSPVLNERLCNILVRILKESTSGELVEFCVELMHSQAEYASASLNLAKAGLCELLIQLLEKHTNLADDIDTRNLFKMACDLIIIVLNDDESMEFLFNKGKGNVFVSMVNWLSSPVEELQVSGVLAIGNFARADSHCIEMVKQGISKKLISLLSKNNTDKGDIKLQHALLSALRNLVIPDQNKAIVIKDGLLDTLYPMTSVSSHPVVFKLIGTFRIVMDKQNSVAQQLSTKKDLIQKVVEWGLTDHPGIQGEASRFLAWLVKNCRNETVVDVMIECNAVPRLSDMIVSDHEMMQNEALVAVTILSSICLKKMENILLDVKIGDKIIRLINEKKPKKEVFINILTLVRQLSSSSALRPHLGQSGVLKTLTEFQKTNDTLSELKSEITEMTKLLESG